MDNDRAIRLTESQLKELMEEAVNDALTKLGVDVTQPLEMQKDFQHLRDWRKSVQTFRTRGVLTILTTLLTGCAAAAWLGIKAMINSP